MDYVKNLLFGAPQTTNNVSDYTQGVQPRAIPLDPATIATIKQAPRPIVDNPSANPVQTALDFHQVRFLPNSARPQSSDGLTQRSKHGFDSYAPGPPKMDWSNQPEVFRHYKGAPKIKLGLPPFPVEWPNPTYDQLCNTPLEIPPLPLNINTLSKFLYYSLALSAWKSTGRAHWSLRVHPSSGALYGPYQP